MTNHFREGYLLYKEACELYGIESVDYHIYISQLTKDQLHAYNSTTI